MATEVAQMAEAFRVEIEKVKGSMIAMEANHKERLQLVEQEVLKMQRRPEYSGTSGRDKLITKKVLQRFPNTAERTRNTMIGASRRARS